MASDAVRTTALSALLVSTAVVVDPAVAPTVAEPADRNEFGVLSDLLVHVLVAVGVRALVPIAKSEPDDDASASISEFSRAAPSCRRLLTRSKESRLIVVVIRCLPHEGPMAYGSQLIARK